MILEITFVIWLILLLLVVWAMYRYHRLSNVPLDNKRRPFTMDEKIKVAEKTVLKFGKAKCWRCGNTSNLEIDHITPLSDKPFGHNGIDNLQLLCGECNKKKGGKR